MHLRNLSNLKSYNTKADLQIAFAFEALLDICIAHPEDTEEFSQAINSRAEELDKELASAFQEKFPANVELECVYKFEEFDSLTHAVAKFGLSETLYQILEYNNLDLEWKIKLAYRVEAHNFIAQDHSYDHSAITEVRISRIYKALEKRRQKIESEIYNDIYDELMGKDAIDPVDFADTLLNYHNPEFPEVYKNIMKYIRETSHEPYLRAVNNLIVSRMVAYSGKEKSPKKVSQIGLLKNPLIFIKNIIDKDTDPQEVVGQVELAESFTILHIAVAFELQDIFEYLLPFYLAYDCLEIPALVSSELYKHASTALREGGTFLHVAAEKCNINMLTILLNSEANVNALTIYRDTPLSFSVTNFLHPDRLAIVELLLNSDADAKLTGIKSNLSPLAAASGYIFKDKENAHLIPKDKTIKQLLAKACQFPEVDILRNISRNLLKDAIAEMTDIINKHDLNNMSAMKSEVAVVVENLDEALLAAYNEYRDRTSDSNGLHEYINEFMPEVIRFGLTKIAKKLMDDDEIHFTSITLDIFELMEAFDSPDNNVFGIPVKIGNDFALGLPVKITKLNEEMFYNNRKILQTFIEAIQNKLKNSEISAAMFANNLIACYRLMASDALMILIDYTLTIEDKSYFKEISKLVFSVVYEAALTDDQDLKEQNLAITQYAVTAKISVDEQIHYLGASKAAISIFELCMIYNLTDFYIAIVEHVETLDKRIPSQNDCTPLLVAVKNNNEEIVNDLVFERNIAVNDCDNDAKSGLYIAAEKGYKNIVKAFIIKNAEFTTTKDRNGQELENPVHVLKAIPKKLRTNNTYKNIYHMLENPAMVRFVYEKFSTLGIEQVYNIIDEICEMKAEMDASNNFKIKKDFLAYNKKNAPLSFPKYIPINLQTLEANVIPQKIADPELRLKDIFFDIAAELYIPQKPERATSSSPVNSAANNKDCAASVAITKSSSSSINQVQPATKMKRSSSTPGETKKERQARKIREAIEKKRDEAQAVAAAKALANAEKQAENERRKALFAANKLARKVSANTPSSASSSTPGSTRLTPASMPSFALQPATGSPPLFSLTSTRAHAPLEVIVKPPLTPEMVPLETETKPEEKSQPTNAIRVLTDIMPAPQNRKSRLSIFAPTFTPASTAVPITIPPLSVAVPTRVPSPAVRNDIVRGIADLNLDDAHAISTATSVLNHLFDDNESKSSADDASHPHPANLRCRF